MRSPQCNWLHRFGPAITRPIKLSSNPPRTRMWARVQERALHAQWTYLLDHSWIYRQPSNVNGDSMLNINIRNEFVEADEGSADPLTRTILFIHGSHCDKSMCENDAKGMICKAWDDLPCSDRFPVQCLLVNLRGSGASSSDDYHNAHTVANATEDVLTLVQSVCTGGVRSPGLIVAYGTLGKAIALCYTHSLLQHGGVTQHVHSEVSGKGAITPPTFVLLEPDETKDTLIGSDGGQQKKKYEFEKDVSDELLVSAQEFLQNGYAETLAKLGLGGPDAPVKVMENTQEDRFSMDALYALSTENPHYNVDCHTFSAYTPNPSRK